MCRICVHKTRVTNIHGDLIRLSVFIDSSLTNSNWNFFMNRFPALLLTTSLVGFHGPIVAGPHIFSIGPDNVLTTPLETAIDSGTISACANKYNGIVRVITGGDNCTADEVEMVWNVQGIDGPPGPEGPPGEVRLFANLYDAEGTYIGVVPTWTNDFEADVALDSKYLVRLNLRTGTMVTADSDVYYLKFEAADTECSGAAFIETPESHGLSPFQQLSNDVVP